MQSVRSTIRMAAHDADAGDNVNATTSQNVMMRYLIIMYPLLCASAMLNADFNAADALQVEVGAHQVSEVENPPSLSPAWKFGSYRACSD